MYLYTIRAKALKKNTKIIFWMTICANSSFNKNENDQKIGFISIRLPIE